MAFQKPQINKISTDIKDLTIYIRTLKKFGKSTLFRDVVLEKYGDPSRGMLIGLGAEVGYKLLDNLNYTQAKTIKELEEIKDWLIEEKGNEHNIELVAFDVVDELFPIFEKEVVRLHNVENPKKQVTSVKAAFGGYNAGVEKVQQMVKDYFVELTNAGIGVWAIAHTKFKNVKQKGDIDDGYMSLSSNFNSNYEAVFGDIFDCVLTGYIDRVIEDETIEVGDKEKTIHHATDEIRKLYFRGTTFIDAGCRFADGAVPEYIVFDEPNMAKKFISTLEDGMRLSKSGAEVPVVQIVPKKTDVKKPKVNSKDEINIDDDLDIMGKLAEEDESVVDEAKNDELIKQIRTKFKTADNDVKKEIKDILTTKGNGTLENTLPTSVLESILSKLK